MSTLCKPWGIIALNGIDKGYATVTHASLASKTGRLNASAVGEVARVLLNTGRKHFALRIIVIFIKEPWNTLLLLPIVKLFPFDHTPFQSNPWHEAMRIVNKSLTNFKAYGFLPKLRPNSVQPFLIEAVFGVTLVKEQAQLQILCQFRPTYSFGGALRTKHLQLLSIIGTPGGSTPIK